MFALYVSHSVSVTEVDRKDHSHGLNAWYFLFVVWWRKNTTHAEAHIH